jgi:formylglycine-generating enzyme required for sulfatase activity
MGLGAALALGIVFFVQRAREHTAHGAEEMLSIPGGRQRLGLADGDAFERPIEVDVKKFRIDRHEVTLAEYQRCTAAGACPPAGKNYLACSARRTDTERHPVNCVTHAAATAYCRWRSARLPAEAEWERAARGTDGREYPWGNEPPLGRACYFRQREGQSTCAVETLAGDVSPFGVRDLGGNVAEWTATPFCSYANPKDCKPGAFATRGGSWDMDNPVFARSGSRDWVAADQSGHNLGFRCARDD